MRLPKKAQLIVALALASALVCMLALTACQAGQPQEKGGTSPLAEAASQVESLAQSIPDEGTVVCIGDSITSGFVA